MVFENFQLCDNHIISEKSDILQIVPTIANELAKLDVNLLDYTFFDAPLKNVFSGVSGVNEIGRILIELDAEWSLLGQLDREVGISDSSKEI